MSPRRSELPPRVQHCDEVVFNSCVQCYTHVVVRVPHSLVAASPVVTLAAIGVSVWLVNHPYVLSAQSEGQHDTRAQVTSLGRLEPESRIIEVSGPPTARVHILEVDELQRVKTGDVCAYLDDHPMRKAALGAAEANLRDARDLHEAETQSGMALLQEAELELNRIAELTPFDVAAKSSVIERLEIELGKAERDLDRGESLREKNVATAEDFDARTVAVRRLEQLLIENKTELSKIESSAELERQRVHAEIESVRAATKRAQIAASVESLAAEVELARSRLEQTIIRAPIDGTVLKIFAYPGERIGGSPILTMGSIDQMYAVAEVYETDVRFVEAGQRATVTSPALAEPIEGTVDRVGLIVSKNDVLDTDPAAPVDARVIEVRVRLDESATAARFSNLQVRVRIRTQ